MLRYISNKKIWNGEPIGGVKHPMNIADIWSDTDLALLGLERVPAVNGGAPADDQENPLNVPLTPVQFHAMLGILGKTAAVEAAVEALPEPTKSVAKARIYYSAAYRRDHPLFAQLAAMVGMTSAQIDAAWPQALEIV